MSRCVGYGGFAPGVQPVSSGVHFKDNPRRRLISRGEVHRSDNPALNAKLINHTSAHGLVDVGVPGKFSAGGAIAPQHAGRSRSTQDPTCSVKKFSRTLTPHRACRRGRRRCGHRNANEKPVAKGVAALAGSERHTGRAQHRLLQAWWRSCLRGFPC